MGYELVAIVENICKCLVITFLIVMVGQYSEIDTPELPSELWLMENLIKQFCYVFWRITESATT